MKELKHVLIATGATGGHIFPAIVVANFFQRSGFQVKLIISNPRIDLDLGDFEIHKIPSAPVVGKKTHLAINSLKIFAGTLKSMPMTLKFKNSGVLIATGAYPSVPPLVAAKLSGMDFYLMEQNVVPGGAVKTFAGNAKAVFTSFPETGDYLDNARVIFTGNPVRKLKRYENPKKFVGIPENQKVVLVVGGSQGARSLTEKAIETARILKDVFFFIQCGKRNLEYFEKIGLVGTNYKIEPFMNDMGLMYSLADVVVSRAGAGTIFEVMSFGIPLILVPLEIARGHQIENARSLVRRCAAIMLRENTLTPGELAEEIEKLLKNEELRNKMINAQKNFAPANPEEKILQTILEDRR